jgi:hypothetical protein
MVIGPWKASEHPVRTSPMHTYTIGEKTGASFAQILCMLQPFVTSLHVRRDKELPSNLNGKSQIAPPRPDS